MRKIFFFIIAFLLIIIFINPFEKVTNIPLLPKEDNTSLPSVEESKEVPTPLAYFGEFELPINGATGYASIPLNLFNQPDTLSGSQETISAGTGFTILDEQSNWWKIEVNGKVGWILHQYCFINLPDIIPSIIYNNTNTYQSKFVSSGVDIPNITGLKLYDGKKPNHRLNKEEFIIPVLYSMASKIQIAQKLALAKSESLIIYEGYRPYAVQESVVTNLMSLAQKNATVYNGIASNPWGVEWFVATGISNHQLGYAIDTSLAKIHSISTSVVGPYTIKTIDAYEEYRMPTNIHELSKASIVFTSPISSRDKSAWRTLQIAPTMNEAALKLQGFAINADLTPLASEWWHFNDLDSYEKVEEFPSKGNFYIERIYSLPPKVE